MLDVHIGVDPGLSGAVCIYSENNFLSIIDIETRNADGYNDTKTRKEVDSELLHSMIFEQLRKNKLNCVTAHFERVGGRGGNSAQSIFSLGDSFGAIRTAVILASKPEYEIYSTPKSWKSALNLSANKQKSIDLACQLDADMHKYLTKLKHHDRSESFLLAYMSQKNYENMI